MSRRINQKCLRCSLLTVEEARQLHGTEGDGCWNDLTCHNRRSHYRHRSERNFKRVIARQQPQPATADTIQVTADLPPSAHLLLILYSDNPHHPKRQRSIHAMGAELWVGTEQRAKIVPVHCLALTQEQLHSLAQQILRVFSERYGNGKEFTAFSELIYRDMRHCPIRPCPLHP